MSDTPIPSAASMRETADKMAEACRKNARNRLIETLRGTAIEGRTEYFVTGFAAAPVITAINDTEFIEDLRRAGYKVEFFFDRKSVEGPSVWTSVKISW